jgi:cytidyltransferase-like protein
VSHSVGGRFETGSVHGRFQPFHNGHLEYVRAALDRCEFLYLGITQFHRRRLVQVDGSDAVHRAQPQSNPLTYFERVDIGTRLLQSEGVARDRFMIIPFPIEEPDELQDFLPNAVPIFTTTYDAWNERKIAVLESQGYKVVNLWTRTVKEKEFEGREIRRLLAAGDPSWRDHVPEVVATVLEELRVSDRLVALQSAQTLGADN